MKKFTEFKQEESADVARKTMNYFVRMKYTPG